MLNDFRLVASPKENRLSLEIIPGSDQGDPSASGKMIGQEETRGGFDGSSKTAGVGVQAGWWGTEAQLLESSGNQQTKGNAASGGVSYAVVLGAAIAGASLYAGVAA